MNVKGYDSLVEVGRGASAVVYQARQIAFDRTVALKVLVSSGLDDDARRRFDRECRAVGNLGWHPRVVPVYDAGVTDSGQPYLAMEFLRSGSLATRLKAEGPLSPQAVTTIGIQVADALEAAHHVGVLHRDVKPGNILTGHFGDIRLADFGIASISSANTSVTDALAGTLSFMAPELLNGDKATPGSDIYSLGSTLYLLLTGSAPYSSETDETPLATLMRITRDPVPDLRVRGIDGALASVIEKAMAKDPASRYQRASEMIDDLAEFAVAKGWPAERIYSASTESPPEPTDNGGSPNQVDDIDPIDGPTVRRVAPSVAPTIDDPEREPRAHGTAPQASTDATSVSPGSVAQGVDDRTFRRSTTPAESFPSTTDPTGEATAATPTPPPAREAGPKRKRFVIIAAAAALVAVVAGAALQLSKDDGPSGVRALESTTTSERPATTMPPLPLPPWEAGAPVPADGINGAILADFYANLGSWNEFEGRPFPCPALGTEGSIWLPPGVEQAGLLFFSDRFDEDGIDGWDRAPVFSDGSAYSELDWSDDPDSLPGVYVMVHIPLDDLICTYRFGPVSEQGSAAQILASLRRIEDT